MRHRLFHRAGAFLLAAVLFGVLGPSAGAQSGVDRVVLIGGLGGDDAYRQTFRDYLFGVHRVFIDTYGFSDEHITVLAEPALAEESFVDGVSTAETIRETFAAIEAASRPQDRLFVMLFGHGSHDGTNAALNIPRRDLVDSDYDELIGGIPASVVVFVNTSSASAPFVRALSGPDRIVITATRTPTQRNATRFPQYLLEALESPAADLDKDGILSVREWFVYAARETDRSFEQGGNLATEHALLDDSGDGEGTRVGDLDGSPDGNLASVTYLQRGGTPVAARAADRPEFAPLLLEKEDVEREIAQTKSRKADLSEDAYYGMLEQLFVRLARVNARIESL